jgi:hypothetical protein
VEIREGLHPEIEVKLKASAEKQRDDELLSMKTDLAGFNLMYGILEDRYNEDLRKARQSTGDTLEYEVARARLDRENQVFELIGARILSLRTELSAPDIVELRQSAETPTEPAEPLPVATLAWVSAGGFLLPIVVVILYRPLKRVFGSRELEDPVFGTIRYSKPGIWRGRAAFDGPKETGVAVHAGKGGPTDADRRAFFELKRRYAELKLKIAEVLFEACPTGLYEDLSEPEQVWDVVRPLGLRIRIPPGSETPQLVLGYEFDRDATHFIRVYLWDWQVARSAAVEA